MPEIIVLGGGLTGLAAALELQRLGLPYTLIEVKPRLGGAICSQTRAGFVFDGGRFLLERYDSWPWLDELGLKHAVRRLAPYRDGELVYFAGGTQQLTDAMAERVTGEVLVRMAASSLGEMGRGFGVCLENGVLRTADAVVVALPARYAAHLLYELVPEAALLLEDYRYDPVARVSLGYALEDVPADLPAPVDTRIKFIQRLTMPERVPEGGVMVRAGVRVGDSPPDDAALAEIVRAQLGAHEPLAVWVRYWPEADPLTGRLPEFPGTLAAVRAALPLRVALAGSDYGAFRLDQQVAAGKAAAQQVAAALA
ncbi:MAG TPA: FAD-dependent oxidoreductase [Candidatus Limnocylindrales bacterium]|nr:FAD-dependent oxidoreductase [Candidatus Limnocylindrales bacterium]